MRNRLAALWITPGGHNVNLIDTSGLPDWSGFALGVAIAIFALYISQRNRIGWQVLFFASGVGFSIAVGWVLTFGLAQVSFNPVTVQSATFTGPSANTLMFFLNRHAILQFDIGLIPGVFLAALIARELRFQGFENADNMKRAIGGAAMMGFGGMLAGGYAIGNGVTGTSIFTGTAWLALSAMWAGAIVTDFLLDQRRSPALA